MVYCDNCGKDFKVKQKVKFKDDIEIVFIECPHCKTQYESFRTSDKIRMLQKEYLNNPTAVNLSRYQREFKKIQALKI